MKPNIFIVGPSGTGKSSSAENLDAEKTAILNTEMKALPFRGAGKFKLNLPVPDMETFHKFFKKILEGEKTEVCLIESFTSMAEHQYRNSGKFFTGFDLWGNYKEEIGKILLQSKNTNKYVIFTGIDQVIEGANGVEERCIAVEGSWKKKVEKEFVIVLYSEMITNENGDPEYRFITNKQKGYEHIPAKSPKGMFPPTIPNDLNLVIKYVEAYYNDETMESVTEIKTESKKEVSETKEISEAEEMTKAENKY